MTEFYEAENEIDYAKALQRRINDGSIWSSEGSAGRAAMDAIKSGLCCLGKTSTRDYWGNRVPSRYDVRPGTHGSVSYVRAHLGNSHAWHIARVK
jgi:hypothetical protein